MLTSATESDADPDVLIRHREGDTAKLHAVSDDLRPALTPADLIIYEWTPYVIECRRATRLQIGSRWFPSITTGVFPVSFDNQLGLTAIRAFNDLGPIGKPRHVEVIASKFVTPDQSVTFLKQILTDLFARLSTSPFALSSATGRKVREAHRSPSLLFAFHVLRHHNTEIIRAIQTILGRPHQRLASDPELVRPHAVRKIDRDAMTQLLKVSHPVPVALPREQQYLSPLQRLRPERIWQQVPAETYDTPENRFVIAVARRLLTIIQSIQRAAWYSAPTIDDPTRALIAQIAATLTLVTRDDRFARLGPMTVTPTQSRVLQRRDGYRELTALWQHLQRSRQPLFTRLQHAIDLRDIATLYEYWVWFELVERVTQITGVEPIPAPIPDDFGLPGWRSSVRFADQGTLHYNRSFQGYSGIRLRPDITWERPDGSLVVLDAKFRMEKPSDLLSASLSATDDAPPQNVKDDDLQKMHTYRDAIPRVKAAVVLYPGTASLFRMTTGDKLNIDLARVLTDDLEGIGALPMSPIALTSNEE